MSATVSRTVPKPKAPAENRTVLPPARRLADNGRGRGATFTRRGGPPAREQERFALTRSRVVQEQAVTTSLSDAEKFPRKDAKTQSNADTLLVRENPATDLSLTISKNADAVIQFVQPPDALDIAPPTITLGKPADQVIRDSRLKKLESTTITSTGAPLPVAVKHPLTHSFSIDLTPIRVHTDARAQHTVRSFNTRAFAYGHHIFLGAGESPGDLRLMAHEVAHVVQQSGGAVLQHFSTNKDDVFEREAEQASAAAVRGEKFTVRERTNKRPQGLLGIDISLPDISIPDPLDWLAGKANSVPGFPMLTVILGMNPINMSPVDRSAANILRGIISFIPGGDLITQAMDNHGIIDKIANYAEEQINALGLTGSMIKSAVTEFISTLDLPKDLIHPGATWNRAEKIFTAPIEQIKTTAKNMVSGMVEIIKDAILKPIAKLAEGTEGYNLLKGVLGKDPITDETVDRSADNLLGPLLKMIGLGDVWQKMEEANAIDRCWQWFQSTISQLIGFVSQIPTLFLTAFKSLTLTDIVLVPRAFAKLAAVFGGFMGDFISWGFDAMFKLLEIVFDVVSPGALEHVKKTGSAMKSIFQDPLPFVGNLVKAAKLGFQNFAGNFLEHLKKGLIEWLTGSLQGVYIPKSLTLIEFGKLALSVLGLSWAQIRGKLVKALGPNGEYIMQGLEAAFDVVQALVNGGPAAAWNVLKDKLTGLKDQIVSGITSMVVEAVVTKAIPKLIAMFIPGAGFISAIISIYDTVMVFVEKISKIIQVVNAFINSIVAIAQGNIGGAAAKVESILSGLLSLAISFLAGFAGLGKISSKIMGVVNKVRGTVDKALDAAIAFIIGKAKKLFAALFGKKKPGKPDTRSAADLQKDLDKAVAEADGLLASEKNYPEDVAKKLPGIKTKYRLNELKLSTDAKTEEDETDHIEGEVNPKKKANQRKKPAKDGQTKIKIGRSTFTVTTKWTLAGDFPEEHRKTTRGKNPPRLKKNLDRRHVVSSQKMAEHYMAVLNPTKWSGAQKILAGKGETVNDPLGNKKIQTVTQARHKKFFNDVKNLFVDDASINRSIGKEKDIPDDWTDQEWKKHLRYIKSTYALDSSFTP